jgi:RNA polymerase sigma factor (TIGR02999 family)
MKLGPGDGVTDGGPPAFSTCTNDFWRRLLAAVGARRAAEYLTRRRASHIVEEPRAATRSVGSAENLTDLLRAWRRGDRAAFDEIAPLIYEELRRIAMIHLRGSSGRTFGPTDLISEAYLRLAGGAQLEFHDRAHFFAIASRSMRQILVDRARRRRAEKRGSGHRTLVFDETCLAIEQRWELVELDEALIELERRDQRKARITELHYFGGLTHEEIAAVCNIHVNTVSRDLRFSKAWLRKRLRSDA